MRDLAKRNAAQSGDSGGIEGDLLSGPISDKYIPVLRFRIEVVHPVDGRPRLWDHYATREAAEVVAATLRHHGFLVRIRRSDDEVQP